MIQRRSYLKRTRLSRGRPRGTRARLERACDLVFSWTVRTRDGWTCQKCGFHADPPTRLIQCAHIISRGKDQIKCDESNALALCDRCHAWFTHQDRNGIEWKRWVEGKYGPELWADLECRQHFRGRKMDWSLLILALIPRAVEVGVTPERVRECLKRELGVEAAKGYEVGEAERLVVR